MYAITRQMESSWISDSVDSSLRTTGAGQLETWSFVVLIERFRKVSSNSLKLVVTHLLEHGAND